MHVSHSYILARDIPKRSIDEETSTTFSHPTNMLSPSAPHYPLSDSGPKTPTELTEVICRLDTSRVCGTYTHMLDYEIPAYWYDEHTCHFGGHTAVLWEI
jgi:hypothetical protein